MTINNIGEATKSIPAEIGSLIYFSADPVWRNAIQKKAMEESRLGIPILFGFDVIHGFRTVYPISLAQACSWNPALVTEAAGVAAKEACLSGVDWTFSPMIDVARDPRWGRMAEGYGEDPYTNSVFGVATVETRRFCGFGLGCHQPTEGLTKEFGSAAKINVAKGCGFDGRDESGFVEAVATAKKSDVVIVCLGEKKEWSGENASRSSISLPAIQEKLVQELRNTGKPIVLIFSNGRPLELVRLEPMADAIVEIWQPGVAGGVALAGILSGKINPSGKLAITFPLTTGQIPTYYNMRQSARPSGGQGNYQDIPTDPLYRFGFGLSYTTFTYGELKLSSTKIKKTDKLTVEVEVNNSGSFAGTETVLWYISDPASSISRPMKELKYFEKRELAADAKTTFKFEIDPNRDLSYTDADGKRFLEAGDYFVIVNNQKVKFEAVE